VQAVQAEAEAAARAEARAVHAEEQVALTL